MLLKDTSSSDVLNKKYNILYVDDEEINLRVFKSTFKKHYNVYTCLSGPEALDLLQTEKIDLIITDQRMPKMNGTELLGKIVPKHPNILRMIMTGFSDLEVIITAVNNFGIHQYITKPWEYQELKETIDNFLKGEFSDSLMPEISRTQVESPARVQTEEPEQSNGRPKEEEPVFDPDGADLKKFTEALISSKADNLFILDKHFSRTFLLNYSGSCEGKENLFIYEFKKEDAVLTFLIGTDIIGIRGTMVKANIAEFAKDLLLDKKAFNPVEFFKDLSSSVTSYLKILGLTDKNVNIQMIYKHISKPNVWLLTNTDNHLFFKHGQETEVEVHSKLSTHQLRIYRLTPERCDRFYMFSRDSEKLEGTFENDVRTKLITVQSTSPEARKVEMRSFIDYSISNATIDKFTLLGIDL